MKNFYILGSAIVLAALGGILIVIALNRDDGKPKLDIVGTSTPPVIYTTSTSSGFPAAITWRHR